MRVVLTFFLLTFLATAAVAQDTFNVHGVSNCGGPGVGVTRVLGPGTHFVSIDGAYSFWNADWNNGGKTWVSNLKVRDLSSGMDWGFGAGTGFQATRAIAAAETAGLVFTFDLATTATVSFYHTDGGGCGDNRSYVTVTLDDPLVVPVATSTWGTMKARYQ